MGAVMEMILRAIEDNAKSESVEPEDLEQSTVNL